MQSRFDDNELSQQGAQAAVDGEVTLGGEEASLWEFEIERKGELRLRKLYLGRSHRWDSYVIVCTAPAADWTQWQPVFDRMVQSFTYASE